MKSTTTTLPAKYEQLSELTTNELLAVEGGLFGGFWNKLTQMVSELTRNPIVIPSDTKLYIPQ